MRRRELAAAVALTAMLAACRSSPTVVPASGTNRTPARPLAVLSGPVALRIPAHLRVRLEQARRTRRTRMVRAFLHRHATLTGARWKIRLGWSGGDVSRISTAAIHGAGAIRLPNRVQDVTLRMPVVRQAYRNDCEAASLSMMLGGRVGQLRLQRELPVARPFTPQTIGGRTVWGDPERGFVGDARGGGYGVYDRPLLKLARRYDPGAENLTGTTAGAVVAALRDGRPVVAWIQFGASAPWTWDTPSGTPIHANHAEHAIALTGWHHGAIAYHNPWAGTVGTFPTATFRALWRTLGDRAIAGSSVIDAATP